MNHCPRRQDGPHDEESSSVGGKAMRLKIKPIYGNLMIGVVVLTLAVVCLYLLIQMCSRALVSLWEN